MHFVELTQLEINMEQRQNVCKMAAFWYGINVVTDLDVQILQL